MRKMKGSGNYLRNQVRKNLATAVICLMLCSFIFVTLGFRVLFTLSLSIFEAIGLLISLVPLGLFYFYLREYRIYRGGWEGEKRVVQLLNSKLSDDYILLNDLCLRNGGGDIDHIVLGPNGIFVLETKNWSGDITCNGDEWLRKGKHSFRGSPSRQARQNASKIKRIIDSSQALRALGIRVERAVVFANDYARLHLNSPTVSIVKLSQLPTHIVTNVGSDNYSVQQLEAIGKEILKQKC
jgi:hypothetical protein